MGEWREWDRDVGDGGQRCISGGASACSGLQGSSGVLITPQALHRQSQGVEFWFFLPVTAGREPLYAGVNSVRFWLSGLGQSRPSSPRESSEGHRGEMLKEKQGEVGGGHAAPVKGTLLGTVSLLKSHSPVGKSSVWRQPWPGILTSQG